ncbi:CoA transferase [Frigidibacter albus]|uniref:CoA transferase n=1 Tax=Frigidibacter albus TaxID=1465486 RepID=A0A6L8VL02_9RHOB|nr:CoA transferase [Frigidibacter albus]MZQ91067.1 CoA transferase [Frigidibacter albus]NBE32952.1 CoA transferase [Frigidibacter albus]GGH62620.1 CoA transferase [Frigidibacter albus]
MTRPLDGIRVLDLGRLIAGPFVGQMLGDMGAEVIKIEHKGQGDIARHINPPFALDKDGNKTGESALSLAMNRNKLSLELDISTPAGQEVMKKLAAEADILVENMRTGTLKRYGLDYEALRQINPGLIFCSISGYGQTGPYSKRSAKDSSLQAMSGLMSMTGDADGEPMKAGYPVADVTAGMYATMAILGALRHREVQDGAGQFIDIGLLDCQIAALGHRNQAYFLTGKAPRRNGNVPPNTAMARQFECADEWMMISADADNEFPVFCQAIGHPELNEDPRFSTQGARVTNIAALLEIMNPIIRSRTSAEWIRILSDARIICAPIYSIAQVFEDPHVQERGATTTVQHDQLGEIRLLSNPIRYSETPLTGYRASPPLGRDTQMVLEKVLELSQPEIDALRDGGAI